VGVVGGIDGLAHVSDLSWDRPGEEIIREFSKGDEIEVVVLAVDPERERISLGLKQASDDPFVAFASGNPKGTTVKGKITEVTARGATVELAENVEGFLRASEIGADHLADARTALNEGEEIESKITSIDRKNRRITLSVKVLDMDIEDQAIQEYAEQNKQVTTTLGDKLKAQLSKDDE
jgi:small subunit ribosomal protein S1